MLTGRLPVMTQELPSTRSSFGSQTRASGLSGTARSVRKPSTTIEKEEEMTREPIHPGKELCEDLDALGVSAAEPCWRIEVPVSRVTEIPNGRRAVTSDTGLRPGRVFGTSGEFWLKLHMLYELRQAEERMGAATTRLPSPDDGSRTSPRGGDIRSSPLRQSPERSLARAGVRGKRGRAVRNLSTTLRHRRFLFTDSFLLLWKWRVG